MSTTLTDPVDKLLDAAESGKSLIKNRDILHFTYIPNIIHHRDIEQKKYSGNIGVCVFQVTNS